MSAYFADANECEVAARVAFAWTVRISRQEGSPTTPPILIGTALAALPPNPPHLMVTAFLSMAHYCGGEKWSSRRWLDEVTKRSRCVGNFRAVFFFDYKGSRRDPRVTNRGVMR